MTSPIQTCILTGLPVRDFITTQHTIYKIKAGDRQITWSICSKCFAKIKEGVEGKQHIILGLILNGKLPDIDTTVIHWDKEGHTEFNGNSYVKQLLEESIYPRSPKDLYDNLFQSIYKLVGAREIDYNFLRTDKLNASKAYYSNPDELLIYFEAMIKDGHFDLKEVRGASGLEKHYKISYAGLNHYIKLTEGGFNSNKCFVAMAFQDETKPQRQAIKNALTSTGFQPVLMDEINISSERTINDEIIVNLKQCKFCVADFTHHKNGVYFESGFAVGQGKPVIYTCEKKEFEKAHFDIKPLQHIIYENPAELEEKLIAKINAWIKP